MEWLQTILDNSTIPAVTALVLGLLTAVSPCPLATNIAAIGYIGKDIESRRKVFFNGLLYTLGRVLAYSILGIVLIALIHKGSETFIIQKTLGRWGEMLLPPALIIIGLLMLFGDRLKLPGGRSFSAAGERLNGSWGSLALGMIFAMAFCPTSAILYFGMLIPMSAAESGGYLLPVIYAAATGLPVIIVAWLLAFSVSGIGRFYNSMKVFQKWFNIVVAAIFILVGIYYLIMNIIA